MSTNSASKPDTNTSWSREGETIDQVVRAQVRSQIFEPNPDAALSIENHCHDVTLRSHSCIMTFDVGSELWLNQSRWSRLIREYVSYDRLVEFIENSQQIASGNARDGAITNMLFLDPPKKAKKHRWGGCLMAATFRMPNGREKKPVLQFYSRTTYMGYMSFLDAAIASVIASHIADPNEIRFEWHIGSSQLHHFKTLPYLYTRAAMYEKLRAAGDKYPSTKHMNSWQNRIERDYEAHGLDMVAVEKYGPFKRVKRRWLQHMELVKSHVPPPLWVTDLNFDKASTEPLPESEGWFDEPGDDSEADTAEVS